jgi:hypothetical protein
MIKSGYAGQAAHGGPKPTKKGNRAHGQARRDDTGCPGRRSAFHLNATICAAADKGTDALLQLVGARLHEMNIVNVSTALHRLARLETDTNGESCGAAVFVKDSRFQALMAAANAKIICSDSQARARSLSSIAWSSARLRHREPAMMQTIGNLALAQISEFKPFELVILLWSFGRMELQHGVLFSKASAHILNHMDDYSASCLATAIWSFAKCPSGVHANVIRKAANAFADRIESPEGFNEVNPVALENVMWGLATVQVRPNVEALRATTKAAIHFLERFKVHEFTITLWAFARLGACDDELFTAAANLIETSRTLKEKMHAQGMANLLWAFGRYLEKGALMTFDKVVSLLLPTCQKLLPEFKPQELSCVLGALSKLGKRWGADPKVDEIFAWTAWRSTTDEFDSFFADLSLKSVVSLLTACVKLMGSQSELREPYNTFMSKLLCLCPRFVDELDEVVALSVLETVPVSGNWAPQVERTMAMVASVAGQRISLYGPSSLARLAAVTVKLPGDMGDLLAGLVAQRLRSVDIGLFSASERKQIAKMCVLEHDNSDATSLCTVPHTELATVSHSLSLDQACPLANGSAGWQSPMSAEVAVHMFPQPTKGPKLPEPMKVEVSGWPSRMLGDGVNICEDPVYLSTPPGLDIPNACLAPETATLVVLEELSGTLDNAKTTITFEINSPKAYQIYNVLVETFHEGHLYDTFEMGVEAGLDIPNTHALSLGCLKDGRHETHFTLNSERYETQGVTTVYRFQCCGGIVQDEGDHAVQEIEHSSPGIALDQIPEEYRSWCIRAFAESSHCVSKYGHCGSYDGSTTAEDGCDGCDGCGDCEGDWCLH